MKLKVIFGIIIPIFIILFLVILASINIGFSADEKFVSTLRYNDIYESGQIKNQIQIGEIKIENDYFLPKRYILPYLVACLNDNEENKPRVYAGQVSYSEFDIPSDQYNSYPSQVDRSIELGISEKKEIKVLLSPDYNLRYNTIDQLLNNYDQYDSLILAESSSSNYYNACQSLTSEELEKATSIALNLSA